MRTTGSHRWLALGVTFLGLAWCDAAIAADAVKIQDAVPIVVPTEELPPQLHEVVQKLGHGLPVAVLSQPVEEPEVAFREICRVANRFEVAHLTALSELDEWYLVGEAPLPARDTFTWGYAIRKGDKSIYSFEAWE